MKIKTINYNVETNEITESEINFPDEAFAVVGPTIDELKQQLADTDYKIIKCYEYQMAGLELPYDIQALHAERQAIRDKIAEMEG